MSVVAMGDAATVTSQENAEEQLHEPDSDDQATGELESRTESASDQRHPLDGSTKKKVLEEEHQPGDAGTLTNADELPETDSRPSASGPNTGNCLDTSEPANSLEDGQVTQSCQRPSIIEKEKLSPDPAERWNEQKPLVATRPPAFDSHDETRADEKAEEEAPPGTKEEEAAVDPGKTTLPANGRQTRDEYGREPRRYEGLTRRPPKPGNNSPNEPRAADNTKREQLLPIEVRLRFDRGGACVVSLIPGRSASSPEGATVMAASDSLDLLSMQEEWYQDVIPEDIGRILRDGAIWSQVGGTGGWSLRGRDLYVLGEHSDLSGWVSQPCLKLGRKHVILCTEQLRPAVEQALRETGADQSVALDILFGSPAGWVVFRDVVPVRPATASGRTDILNALRPLPELEICLEGGVRLEYTAWLDGYPPLIRVYGDLADTPEVLIDGCTACCGDDGAYRATAWDATGTHTIWCAGIRKSYSIVPFQASWALWDAYMFSVAPGSDRRVSICGPVVRDASASHDDWTTMIQVPYRNTVILGAAPGEHALAVRASQVRGMPCIASPSFRPVWALPPDPLRCIKRTSRILFLGEHLEPIPRVVRHPISRRHPGVDTWANLILNASRKGLVIEPDTERARALWGRYKRAARSIWRFRK